MDSKPLDHSKFDHGLAIGQAVIVRENLGLPGLRKGEEVRVNNFLPTGSPQDPVDVRCKDGVHFTVPADYLGTLVPVQLEQPAKPITETKHRQDPATGNWKPNPDEKKRKRGALHTHPQPGHEFQGPDRASEEAEEGEHFENVELINYNQMEPISGKYMAHADAHGPATGNTATARFRVAGQDIVIKGKFSKGHAEQAAAALRVTGKRLVRAKGKHEHPPEVQRMVEAIERETGDPGKAHRIAYSKYGGR